MFLTEHERQVAVRRMKQDSQGAMVADDARDEHFHWHWVHLALKSPNTIICSLAWFFLLVPIYVSYLLVGCFEGQLLVLTNPRRAFRSFYLQSSDSLATQQFTHSC